MRQVIAKIAEDSRLGAAAAEQRRPIVLLTIENGAAHTKAAEAIAKAWAAIEPDIPAHVVEVSAFMSPIARFTHVSAYLWLVKNAPVIWEKIDRYQKKQEQTSPDWFYRREFRRLFELVDAINPAAFVATEVGCGEIAALIKRDLHLKIPLVAVNLDYDADRAWIRPETDLYCLPTLLVKKDFLRLGADAEKIKIWGAPLEAEFSRLDDDERQERRRAVCDWLGFDADIPILLVSGGGEGLGKVEPSVKQLVNLPVQIVALCGRNKKLKERLEKFASEHGNIRVLGWTDRVPDLMQASDLLISKLGMTFYEAMACELPIIAFPPPPGAERVQYNLLDSFGVGRALGNPDELPETVAEFLRDKELLRRMRKKASMLGQVKAAERLALWLRENIR